MEAIMIILSLLLAVVIYILLGFGFAKVVLKDDDSFIPEDKDEQDRQLFLVAFAWPFMLIVYCVGAIKEFTEQLKSTNDEF